MNMAAIRELPAPVHLRPFLRPKSGFTLIEMLVVLLVAGLLFGLSSVIMRPSNQNLLRTEAERLAQLLELAGTESRLTGKRIAWTTDGRVYRFWRYSEGSGWSDISNHDVLHMRTLPPGILVTDLLVEAARKQGAMRIEFWPYSQILSFTMEISLGAERYAISGSPVGQVRVTPVEGKANGAEALL